MTAFSETILRQYRRIASVQEGASPVGLPQPAPMTVRAVPGGTGTTATPADHGLRGEVPLSFPTALADVRPAGPALPPDTLARLTEQVVRAIDQRVHAQRERFGRF